MKWYKVDIREIGEAEYEKWFSVMSEEKQKRVEGFKAIEDKKRTVAGDMLARKAVAEWCGIKPENIVFKLGEHGKPYVKDLDVHFNISHSENLVVCAVADKPVGIDIERIRPINLSIAKRICTEKELEYLFGFLPSKTDFKKTDDRQTLLRFFELWTAKEAFAKCQGKGLKNISLPMQKEVEKHIIDNEYFLSIYK